MKRWQWILAFTWELPQTLCALLCRLFIKCMKLNATIKDRLCYLHTSSFLTAWSLGEFLFFNEYYLRRSDWEQTYKHEYGHSRQSRILGPLYLILIALPSVIWNLLSRISTWCAKNYYNTPWEAWADKLGGVER